MTREWGFASHSSRPTVQSATTGGATRLTEGRHAEDQPAWSPDGTRIAFTSNRGREADLRYRPDIWVVDVASRKSREVTHSTEWTVSGGANWSPDGTRLAISTHLTTLIRDERRGAFIVNVASGALTPVKAAGLPF